MLGTFLRKHLKTYCLCNCFSSIHLDWLQLLSFAKQTASAKKRGVGWWLLPSLDRGGFRVCDQPCRSVRAQKVKQMLAADLYVLLKFIQRIISAVLVSAVFSLSALQFFVSYSPLVQYKNIFLSSVKILHLPKEQQ